MTPTLLSIIVPVYNQENYLARCVESVLKLAGFTWELILIDDGSTDHSGSICDKYAYQDKRIRTFHQSNHGVSASRNLGLSKMQGEYVMFLDSDDWIDAEVLRFYMNEMVLAQADLLQSPTDRVKGEKSISTRINCVNGMLSSAKDYINACNYYLCIGGSILRTSIINENALSFRENIRLAEDQIFLMDYMCLCNQIYSTTVSFYNYYYCESSATNTSKSIHMIDSSLALITYKEKFPEFAGSIDYTLLYFLWYIIKNNDIPNSELSQLINRAKLSYTKKISKVEKIFISLSHIYPFLAIMFVRSYTRIKKW